ncbi:histidine--tRNA ligase [Calderihabitans maritimus]|uniref:Histidine--tRNA ligase n=1 Tax=Calderihabitans maritimus TaxID=1246530 RepID=A0A1Z5HT30_9FIRM|nr:histidine--tRNA ligase [Calderihabitans maritimus]GAW92693.1 histidyl-tRNA synthetase [Calderihabitans maritimus]
MLTTRPRGTNDILPDEAIKWQYLEKIIREICEQYGYEEIRTPIFEHTELFYRGVGETTDIVEKEMYTFTDRSDRSLTLRPEGTAPVVRAFLEHKLYSGPQPTKLYYVGPMFRYGRPQAGRFRQFHQFGIEVFGSRDPAVDAEVIGLAMDFYERLGLRDLELNINSVGCPQCRPRHRLELQGYLKPHAEKLCPTCRNRFERNPLRIFDCKNTGCQELVEQAPTITGSLCNECNEHFQRVKKYLDTIGVQYVVNEKMVRGLDYYTNTAFEIIAKGIGAQSSIGGGGRYDGLVEACGGPSIPGIGFGLGLERILLAMEQQGVQVPKEEEAKVFVAVLGEKAKETGLRLAFKLRKKGVAAEIDYLDRSLKAQMKAADRYGARFTVIIGEQELEQNKAVVRNMITGEQEEAALEAVEELLLKRLN